MTAATIHESGTYLVDLDFAWPGGTARRRIDMEPYLAASRAHESMLGDHEAFGSLRAGGEGISWTNCPTFSAELLLAAFWPDEADTTGFRGSQRGSVVAGRPTAEVAGLDEERWGDG